MAGRDLVVRYSGSATDLRRATGEANRSIGSVGDEAERTSRRGSRAFGLLAKVGPALAVAGGVAAGGFVVAGAAAVGLGAKALQAALTVDDAQDKIRTSTGATGKRLEGLEGSFKRVAARTPADMGKVADAVGSLNQRLDVTGPTLDKLSQQVLEAGRLGGADVDITKLTSSFAAFEVRGKSTTGAMDDLFRVSQATGVKINDLTSIMSKQGKPLQALGFSFRDTASLIGSLSKAGVDTKSVTGALGKSLVNLAKDGEKPKDAFRRVTGELQALVKKGDEAGALNLAAKVFGTKGAPQFVAALKSGKVNLDDLGGAATKSKDTILGVADATADFPELWQKFKNQATLALAPLGGQIMGGLTNVMKDAQKWIDQNRGSISRLGGVVTSTFATIGSVTKAGLGVFIGGLTNGKHTFSDFASFVSTHQEDITRGIVGGGKAALELGIGLAKGASLGLRGFAVLADGQAAYVENATAGFGQVLAAAAASFGWIPGVGDKLKGAEAKFAELRDQAVGSLHGAADGARGLADGLDKKIIPAAERARAGLDRVGNAEIAKAKQRDAIARVAVAIDGIGTKADGSQIKLKRWRDVSDLAGKTQHALRLRIFDASHALADQLKASQQAGAGQKSLTKTWETGRKRLADEFRQMGLSKAEAGRLAAKYAGIKPKVKTKFETPGMGPAKDNADALKKKINDIPNHKNVIGNVNFKTNASGVVVDLNKQFQLVKGGPKMSIGADGGRVLAGPRGWSSSATAVSPLPRHELGGRIVGRGGPRQDNIAGIDRKTKRQSVWVSANEFIVNAREYARRRRLVELLNAGASDRALAAQLGAEHGLAHRAAGGGVPSFFGINGAHSRAMSRGAGNGSYMLGYAVKSQLDKLIKATRDATRVSGNFGKIDVSHPRALTTFRGGTFTNLFAANLRASEVAAKRVFSILQGGFRPATSYSGTSHRGDAIDARVDYALLRQNRKRGIPTWDRTGKGNWVSHMHGIPLPGAGYPAGSAVWQGQDYLRGGDGLASGGPVRPVRHLLRDNGGWLPPGRSLVDNHTGRPELVLNGGQEAALRGTKVENHYHFHGVTDGEGAARAVRSVLNSSDQRANGIVLHRRTARAVA